MRSHKGIIFVLMLILGFGAVGISSVFLSNPQTLEIGNPIDRYELAYIPHDAIWIQSNEEMIDQADDESWPGNGSAESPFIITGYSFNQDTQPLRIWNTDLHWIFIGNLVDSDGVDMQCGTWIDGASNGVITDNIFRNRHSGMVTMNVVNVNITNNVIHGNTGFGVELLSGFTDSEFSGNTIYDSSQGGIRVPQSAVNSTISDNTVYDCGGIGISISTAINCVIDSNTVYRAGTVGLSVALCTNTVVSSNTITNTSDDGLQLYGFTTSIAFNNNVTLADGCGIALSYCESSNITCNTIENCIEDGFIIESTESTTVCWNLVKGCTGYALHLSDSTENVDVIYNTFEDNGDTCQICDDGQDNIIQLNFYSEWTSPDIDADGIVDNPYEVDGTVGNEDPYPVAVAGVIPVIEEPTTTTTTTSTTTPTTTPTDGTGQFPMDIVLLGAGAVVAIVIISGAVMLKKR